MARLQTVAAVALSALLVASGLVGAVGADGATTATADTDTVPYAESNAGDENATAASRDGDATIAPEGWPDTLADRLGGFDLTDAQTDEIVTEAERLREAGASRLVIRSTIVTKLYSFGVDAPFLYAGSDGDGHEGLHRVLRALAGEFDLTGEQARELHDLVHRMHEDGATRGEIRRAVREKLGEFGVEDDEFRESWREHRARMLHDRAHDHLRRAHRLHHRAARLYAADDPPGVDERLERALDARFDLTDAQTDEIVAMAERMREDGAARGEIREAIREKLEEFGVDLPADREPTAMDGG